MNIHDLIAEYIKTASTATAQLRSEFGEENLLAGWHQRRIPQRGVLRDGARYQFHGIGCSVERGKHFIDFDFGYHGRTDGFDAWRLWRFAEQYPKKYPELQSLSAVQESLECLLSQGVVCRSGVEGDRLLYLCG